MKPRSPIRHAVLLLAASAGVVMAAAEVSEPKSTAFTPSWKQLSLQTNGPASMTWGFEARLKYEFYSEPALNQRPEDADGFWLQRYLIHSQIHATPWMELFGQLQSSLENDRAGGPRPTDSDDIDLHQAYVDLHVASKAKDDPRLALWAGRQEFSYGSQRLISVRDSPNNRLAFDAFRLRTQWRSWKTDGWVAQPVEIDSGAWDDQRLKDVDFWGIYTSGPLDFWKGLNLDFYLLGLHRERGRFAAGTAEESRRSVGTRIFGQHDSIDWNFELVGQWGSFGDRSIAAWTTASETGWTWLRAPGKPRFFLKADMASGDHGGKHLGTFNPLFPRGSYFNEASLIGPQNLLDLQPGLSMVPAPHWKATLSTDLVWRQSLEDGTYGVAGNVQANPGFSNARHVGTFPACSVTWTPNEHLMIAVHYVAYLWGDFIRETLPTEDNGHYFSLSTSLRF